MNKKSVADLKDNEIASKRILVRVDFNVPMDGATITDDTRIKAALPTIKYLLERKGRVILVSHMGRPKGEVKPELKMDPVAKRLGELLNQTVAKVDDCVGPVADTAAKALKDGEVLLLENVRFHKEETKGDENFAKQLASLAELYVNDAFGTAHRAHASTTIVAKFLPAYAGFLMQKELDFLGKALADPKKPFVAIIGGAKVSSKIGVIKNLLTKVDTLIVAGGMAYTFFKAKGVEIGDSLVEDDQLDTAKEILKAAVEAGVTFLLPLDHVVGDKFAADAKSQIIPRTAIPVGWRGMDIGPDTVKKFKDAIKEAKTIVWNGPMGVFEFDKFAKGTMEIAEIVGEATKSGAISIIGGGDSVAAVKKAGLTNQMSHISTGGGASLEFLEGKTLPGVACLLDK